MREHRLPLWPAVSDWSAGMSFTAEFRATQEPVRRPAKVARMLALAHHIRAAIDRGEVADRATVARRMGLTRARVSPLLDLRLLAQDVRLAVLGLFAVDGGEPLSERALRAVVHAGNWEDQRGAWHRRPPGV